MREVEPGELVRIDAHGLRSRRAFAGRATAAASASSSTSTSRAPTAGVFGETVDRVRRRIGHRLAEEHPADADVVIAVPDSSNSIALGYSEALGICRSSSG